MQKTFFRERTLSKLIRFVQICLAFLFLATVWSFAGTTVVVTNPSPSLTVPEEFGVSAYAYGDQPIHVLQIYLDRVGKVYQLVNPPHNRINALITSVPGTRLLTVQAVDDNGKVLGLSQFNFNVTSTPVVLSGLDQVVGNWKECAPANGCFSSANNTPTPALVAAGTPDWNGESLTAEFRTQNYLDVPAPAYDTAFWWLPHAAPQTVAHYFKYQFDLYVESVYANRPQALEFQMQETVNGYVYNMAWQATYAGDGDTKCGAAPQDVWRVFDYGRQCWEQVDLPFTRFEGNTWYQFSAEFHVDANGVVWHDALTVTNSLTGESVRLDPSAYNSELNAWQSISRVPPRFLGRSNQWSNAVQLDINSEGSVYRIFVDKMSVTYVP